SGVQYGHGLEAARELIATARRPSWLVRTALGALTTSGLSRVIYFFARLLRSTGIPRRLAGWNRFGFAMGMLAATDGLRGAGRAGPSRARSSTTTHRTPGSSPFDDPARPA